MAWLVAAMLIALSGCSSLKVKLGMRVDLTKTPVTSLEATLPNGPGMSPGEKTPLVVQATLPDGKQLLTEGKGGGKIQWKDLMLTTSVVTADAKGNLHLAGDPRVSDGKVGHVSVMVPSQPNVPPAELDIHFQYNVAFVANFSGPPGISGSNGMDGLSGANGSSGSTDPNNPSPGGNGGNGTNGSDGGDGGPGGDAPPVDVQVTLRSVPQPLLEIAVSAPGKRRLYLVDPQGGSLTVKADGGPGGAGGRGGRGGSGGSGGIGTPSGSSGSSGMDGRNGFDGPRGKGGQIRITVDPKAQPYISAIHTSSLNGPPPQFRSGTVPPLW